MSEVRKLRRMLKAACSTLENIRVEVLKSKDGRKWRPRMIPALEIASGEVRAWRRKNPS